MTSARPRAAGWVAMLTSTAAFGTSGAFAKPMIEAGWSPASLVTARLGGAALVLLLPALWAMRGRWGGFASHLPHLLGYGLFAGMVAQLAFFNAAATMPVSLAILFEYLGIVWVVLWGWLVRGRQPRPLTVLGMVLAIVGLAVVVNPTAPAGLSPAGVLWGFAASLGLAVFYVVSAEADGLPPVAFVSFGLGIGALGLVTVQLLGLQPVRLSTAPAALLSTVIPWWAGLAELVLVAAVLAYLTGFYGTRALGATTASFVGLTEVLFAVAWAWILLGESITAPQAFGAAVLLGGVALVQRGSSESLSAELPEPVG